MRGVVTQVASNSGLSSVRDQVRSNALQSLEFYANSVLALSLPADVCSDAQDVCEDQESMLLRTRRPRALAIALTGWLGSRGVTVLSDVQLPSHEILDWLCLVDTDLAGLGCTVRLLPEGVELTWL